MALDFVADTVLPRRLAASVQSTVLVVAVWVLCRLLPRLSAATRTALWWLVALQLVIGLLWSSPLALPLLPAASEPAIAAHAQATSLPAFDALAPAMQAPPHTAADVSRPVSWFWIGALAVMWLLGLGAMIVRSL